LIPLLVAFPKPMHCVGSFAQSRSVHRAQHNKRLYRRWQIDPRGREALSLGHHGNRISHRSGRRTAEPGEEYAGRTNGTPPNGPCDNDRHWQTVA
jgi:hypothetical protein